MVKFLLKLMIDMFGRYHKLAYQTEARTEFHLDLTEIWVSLIQKYDRINEENHQLVKTFAEISPFLKSVDNYFANEKELDLLSDQEQRTNMNFLLEDLKRDGFKRKDKLKEKSTYLLYVFLYYNLFQSKLEFIKENEEQHPELITRIKFFE